MRTRAVWITLGVTLMTLIPCLQGTPAEPEVEIGEPLAAVIAKLGPPEGQFQTGSLLTLYYNRGMIDLIDGCVVRSSLVSSEESRRIRQEQARQLEEQQKKAEAERQRLIREGARQLKQILDDPDFARRPAENRLVFWRDFARQFPHTDITLHLDAVLQETTKNRQKIEADREIGEIKKRLAEIEARFVQLDKDYAASLAHWKRNEIQAERAKLTTEKSNLEARFQTLAPPAP